MDRFSACWLLPTYLRAKAKLVRGNPALENQIVATEWSYLGQGASLQRKPIHGQREVFRTRVNAEARIIDEPLAPDRPDEVALLYVGHHDVALDWGKAAKDDPRNRLQRAKRLRPKVDESEASASGTYGELLNETQLRKLGVVEERVAAVQTAAGGAPLEALGIPADVAANVLRQWMRAQPGMPLGHGVPYVEEPPPVLVTRETFPSYLKVPLGWYFKRVTEEQLRLIQRPGDRLYAVRGAAGTGKTIIGIRRVEHILQQADAFETRQILFTCFNNVLADSVEQMLAQVLGDRWKDGRVEVRTAYRVVKKALEALVPDLGRYTGSADRELLPLLASARAALPDASPLGRWSDEELLDEIDEVIYSRDVRDRESYLQLDRTGRGRGMDRATRDALWSLYRDFHQRCRAAKRFAWSYFPAKLLRELERQPRSTGVYAGLVIDEVQDLPPCLVRALLALQAGDDRNMIVLGDAAQNVYRSGFRWKDLGLSITGAQSTVLKTSYRSTAPIIGAATSLLKGQARRLGDDLVLPEREDGDNAASPKVRLWTFRSRDEELQSVAFDIDRLINRGANPGSVGVLVDDPEARRIVGRLLAELEQPSEDYQKEGFARRIDVFEPSVKLLSTGSAKGLEFQVLYLPQVTAATFPVPPDDTDEADRRRRSLYTAILRGSWQVTISTVAGAESPLLAELGKNWIEAARPNDSSPDAQ